MSTPDNKLDPEEAVAMKIAGVRRLMRSNDFASDNFKSNAIDDECQSIADMCGPEITRHAVRSICADTYIPAIQASETLLQGTPA